VQAIEWRSWDAGQKEAKVTKKIIMIEAVSEGCHFCEAMERNVFDDVKMSQWIEDRFVPVKIDLSTEELPIGLKATGTPSFYFIEQEMNLIKTVRGSWSQEDLRFIMLKVLSIERKSAKGEE